MSSTKIESKLTMAAPTLDAVRTYYDERIEGKIRDFTHFNPRIEAAIQTLAEWAPANPKRILEIGCGIGATSWRMARAWPEAEVIGVDVSPTSIEVAKTCFRRSNLSYHAGLINQLSLTGKFDLILLMDVYEHIPVEDRPTIHAATRSLLSDESRIVLTSPTPAMQEYLRLHYPLELQPVDENITLDALERLAVDTATDVLYYRKVGIWRYGDYTHCVLGRVESLGSVLLRQHKSAGIAGIKEKLKDLVGFGKTKTMSRRNYLGLDFLGRAWCRPTKQFKVSVSERKKLASLWPRRNGRSI